MEQIDGVIELEGHTYYVEMKWVKEPLGGEHVAQHLVRLFTRPPEARGMFISAYGYKDTAIAQCREALAHRAVVMCTLEEIVCLLEKRSDLLAFFKNKAEAALNDKTPFIEIK